jgi:hypothetical protein
LGKKVRSVRQFGARIAKDKKVGSLLRRATMKYLFPTLLMILSLQAWSAEVAKCLGRSAVNIKDQFELSSRDSDGIPMDYPSNHCLDEGRMAVIERVTGNGETQKDDHGIIEYSSPDHRQNFKCAYQVKKAVVVPHEILVFDGLVPNADVNYSADDLEKLYEQAAKIVLVECDNPIS